MLGGYLKVVLWCSTLDSKTIDRTFVNTYIHSWTLCKMMYIPNTWKTNQEIGW